MKIIGQSTLEVEEDENVIGDENRPFTCDFPNCHSTFSSKRFLDHHRQLHLNKDKIFYCDVPNCHSSFSSMAGLVRHKKTHLAKRNIFKCEYEGCTKVFQTKHVIFTMEYNI
jgi:hypothetical protein